MQVLKAISLRDYPGKPPNGEQQLKIDNKWRSFGWYFGASIVGASSLGLLLDFADESTTRYVLYHALLLGLGILVGNVRRK